MPPALALLACLVIAPDRVDAPGKPADPRAPPADPPAVPAPDDGEIAAEPEVDQPVADGRTDASSQPAPRARWRGQVLAFGEREPIPGALLVPRDGGPTLETDEEGRFSVDLPPGTHAYVIRAQGFEDLEVTITLQENEDALFEYRLDERLGVPRYRTVVKEDRAIAVSSTTLTDEEIHAAPGTRGDPLRVVSSLPGVATLAGFLPYVVVRGAAPGNTGYYLDGTRVPALFHVAIGPSVIHPYFIDVVDFYPSGAPVRLGRFVSGIIEARTRPARRDRVHGDVEVRLTDAGALLEIPFNRSVSPGCLHEKRRKCKKGPAKGALTLAGRYSYTAGILTLVQSEARIAYWDYQSRLDHRLGPRADFTAFAYGSFDHLGAKATSTSPAETYLRFHFHRIDTRVRQRLPRGGTAQYVVVLGADETGVQDLRTVEWRVAPRLDVLVPIDEVFSVGFGLDQEFQIFRLADDLFASENFDVEDLGLLFADRFVSVTGLYLEGIARKGKLEARPGIRTDIYAQVGASPYLPTADAITHAVGVDPRLLVRERLSDRWTLRQAVGLYHQPPSFPVPVPGIENFGFERGLQRNLQGSFGYELTLPEARLSVVQEAYFGWLTNLQDYELGASLAGEEFNELEDAITQVSGYAYGLETMVRLDPTSRLFGWAAYTLSRSTRDYRIGGRAPADWDQRHILNLVLGYQLSHKWSFSGRMHYHTGRPWTAPVGGQNELVALAENRNNARLPAYFQLDLRVARTWRWPNWQLEAILEIANATYSREIFACLAEEPENEARATARMLKLATVARVDPARAMAQCSPQGFRYIIPSAGLKARF